MASKSALGALARATVPRASTSRIASMSAVAAAPKKSKVGRNKYLEVEEEYLDFPPLQRLEPTHGVHVATLHLRAHTHTTLDFYSRFALHAARNLNIPTSGVAALPTARELVTVPKSPFVYKKAQENFERKTHKRAIKVFDADQEVLDLLLRYLKQHAMGGIGIKAYIHEYADFGFAAGEIAELEGMLGGDVQAATEEIIRQLGGVEFEAEKAAEAEAKAESETAEAETPKAEATEAVAEVKEAEAEVKEQAKEVKPQPTETKAESEPKA